MRRDCGVVGEMTKHLDEVRDRWAKAFKNRVKAWDEVLSKEPVEDLPTPLIRECDWCGGDMRDIGVAETGMGAGRSHVFLCECGHEVEASPKDDWDGCGLGWKERNPVKNA